MSSDEILADYPDLEAEDLLAALEYACSRLAYALWSHAAPNSG
jgi:uncharacterized protein (DUF433 family)